MKNEPIVSILMPTYNQEKYVGQAIESVLNQNFDKNYVIIIGDDCSTDNTRTICEKYQNKYPEAIKLIFNESNLGIVKNYQNLFNQVNSKYIQS